MKFEKMNALAHLVSATVNHTTVGLALLASVTGISTFAHAQDECAQAVTLTVGTPVTFTFTSTFPTASTSIPVDTQCADGTLLWTETTPDLWYRFVAPANGLLTLDTCEADPFNSADTSLVLYTGDCGSLVQVACNGDFFGFNPAGTCSHTTARINSYLVIEGTTYLVRVASIDGSLGTILPGHITATMSKVGGWGQTGSGQISAPSALGLPSKISTGTQHVLGLSGGVVFAWGNNGSGRATVPAGLGTVIDISAGGSHSLALRSGGTVAGWGLDTSLRATGGSTVTNAVAIAAGGSHSLAALATGTVFGWGVNTNGQITIPAGLTGVVKVTAGVSHSVALRSNGAVTAWGLNTGGQATVPGGLVASKIASSASSGHTLALRENGTIIGWGLNTSGQTNIPAGLTGMIDVAAGAAHSIALFADGTVATWGSNNSGELTVPSNLGPSNIVAAGAGYSLTVFNEDALDLCPNDPNKLRPGQCGCGVADTDTDSDGTLDCNDGCPTVAGLLAPRTFFADVDLDTFGNAASTTAFCSLTAPEGFAANSTDCDDASLLYADADNDTYGAGAPTACGVALNTDCNDSDAAINPAATEICEAANVDENCNNLADNADSGAADAGRSDFYADSDSDSYTVAAATRFCDIAAGYLVLASASIDCNDSVAAINPGATEICDAANADENCNNLADNADIGATDASKSDFFADSDADTYTVATATRYCDIVTGYLAAVSAPIDCNDSDAAINPGATEICDAANVDENCNNLADNADIGASDASKSDFFADSDSDTYTAGSATRYCDIVTGYFATVSASIDCNDSDAAINPAATEICDAANVDENCNNLADNADSSATDAGRSDFFADSDSDSYTVATATRFCDIAAGYLALVSASIDCNDAVAAINPGATEICDVANVDENCNNLADNADIGASDASKSDFFADPDADTYTVATATRYCDIVTGYLAAVSASIDCNDSNAAINPGATEICDALDTDENCNGFADNADNGAAIASKSAFFADADADTYTVADPSLFCDIPATGYIFVKSVLVDCNDTNNTAYPGAVENCANDGVDNNCNGEALADDEAADSISYCADIDSDGFGAGPIVKCCTTLVGHVTDGTDCNDADATVYPGAVENCANVTVDNNCNGSSAESEAIDLITFFADTDGDGSGDSAVPALACSAPSGYTLVAGDGCPSDANKITPGICGCGTTDADGDNDGLVYCFDNCPSVANADQANCDSDTLGNACDLDDDNDGAFDINDAFACNAAKSNLDSTFTTAQISAFLTTASAATVDATGMSIEQLGAIADGASSIAANGISGTFTVNSALTSAQISAILGKVQPIGGVGGAIVTVDATNMTDAQLGVVAASIASVTTVENVSITASLNANAIAALVSKTPAGEAAVNATGMSAQQLMASISGSTTVTITGTVSITSALTAAQIAEITGSIAPGTTVNVDTLGMSAAQQAALLNATAIIVDSDAAVSNGGTFTVYIDLASMPVRAVGIQARVMFDPAILQFVPPVPDPETGVYSGVGGLDFPMEIFLAARANSVDFSTGVDFVFGPGQGILGGNVAQLTFRAIAPVCAANNLVWIASSGFNTCISSEAPANGAAVAIPYSMVNLANISALNLVDFAGVPVSDPSSAADAGTLLGAAFTQPTVTASNNCGSLAVTTTISYPADSGIANGSIWPSHFPIGVSTVTWSAVDARGVTSSVSRTYTVLNYQLATIDVDLVGGVNANLSYTLPIRVRLSTGLVVTTNVAFTGNSGAATDIQIPVRSDYSCISVKDATHTVSAAQTLQVTGAKYTTSVPLGLVAGDSNDDNLVDILDFGHFVSDRGAGKTAQSRSNFDRNLFVNNGDFGFISINFLRTGDLCGGGYTGNAPIERVSVKDLRRAGLGHMAAADINNDGWVDASDMALAMQGIYRRDVPTTLNAADEVQTTRW